MRTSLLGACCLALSLQAGSAWAASSPNYIITHDTFSSGAGAAASPNYRLTTASLGEVAGGAVTSASYRVVGGYPMRVPDLPPGARQIIVEGTIDDPTATVMVNGLLAAVAGTAWAATGVPIVEGDNTITVTATDPLGNSASRTITVYLDTHPPARPTVERGGLGNNVAPNTFLTTAAASLLSGTKVAGTSVWINGVQVVAPDAATTWSANVALHEGDNTLTIVTKDAAGNTSTAETLVVVVDNLPPVITVSSPPQPYKTNLTPLTFTGTVDDRLTTVTVNSTTAARTLLGFQADLPLILGANTFTITATSPLGHVSTKRVDVLRGTIPTILSMQPADATKIYAGQAVTFGVVASDAESDPMQYQFLFNGSVVVGWTASPTQSRTPTDANAGVNTVEIRVRDGYGGYASQQADVFVLHNPISPP